MKDFRPDAQGFFKGFFALSRNSIASYRPVEAPEGTAARPKAPVLSLTSTSTVGLPLESRISRALMLSIVSIAILLHEKGLYG
jgi:hypothetical protein